MYEFYPTSKLSIVLGYFRITSRIDWRYGHCNLQTYWHQHFDQKNWWTTWNLLSCTFVALKDLKCFFSLKKTTRGWFCFKKNVRGWFNRHKFAQTERWITIFVVNRVSRLMYISSPSLFNMTLYGSILLHLQIYDYFHIGSSICHCFYELFRQQYIIDSV